MVTHRSSRKVGFQYSMQQTMLFNSLKENSIMHTRDWSKHTSKAVHLIYKNCLFWRGNGSILCQGPERIAQQTCIYIYIYIYILVCMEKWLNIMKIYPIHFLIGCVNVLSFYLFVIFSMFFYKESFDWHKHIRNGLYRLK